MQHEKGGAAAAGRGDKPEIVLASGSPRRRALLDQMGIAYRSVPADIDESPRPGESAPDYTRRLAVEKVAAVLANGAKGEIVLGADTTVVLDGRILGKPADRAEAREMLKMLSGRTHEVYSAVAVAGRGGRIASKLNVSEVSFGELEDDWIDDYIATGEPMDKAGAYAIQGRAAWRIREIRGSHSGIMGLPLFETAALLIGAGLSLAPSARR